MAAYLAGRRGTRRDALLVGATVTATHTAGVLVLGLAVSVSAAFAPEGVLRWLGVGSGLLVAGVGGALLVSARRARRTQPVAQVQAERVLVGVGAGHSYADTDGPGHDHGHAHAARRTATGMGMGTGTAMIMGAPATDVAR